MSSTVLRARWVMPITSPAIEHGRIAVEDGCITTVARAEGPERSAIDYGDAVILPGFVNAHAHLELTCCKGLVPFDGCFVSWIERLAALCAGEDADNLQVSIRDGLRQSLVSGVTTTADIGYGPRALDAWRRAPVNVVGFLEVLGMGPKATADHELSVAQGMSLLGESKSGVCGSPGRLARKAARAEARGSLMRVGLAPHAPYSTDAAVYRSAVAFARRTGRPLCTHLAETREERQFLTDGTGPFRELLERRGLWDGSFQPPGCSPVQYADELGLLAAGALLVHVNDATDRDLDVLARRRSGVVYCPRSHAFFGHAPHRYGDMLERGINVCIGTDSLASNDSLSILDELRFIRQRDRQTTGDELLRMGTMAGARALGVEATLGSLEPGKQADLVVLPLNRAGTKDPVDDLLAGDVAPISVHVGGSPAKLAECDRHRGPTRG